MSAPKYWREIPQRYRLEAGKCKKCSKVFFPPRLVCNKCGTRKFSKINLPEYGKVYTYTVVHVSIDSLKNEIPYVLGIIDLGVAKITAQIVDCIPEDVKIGNKVKIVFRKITEESEAGINCYGYKAVLV